MFGRRKREIEREGQALRKQLEQLEGEAERLNGELETIHAQKNDPYYDRPIRPSAAAEGDVFQDARRPRFRTTSQPTRLQFRRKRNLAVALIIVSVFLLSWIVAKVWRYLG